jgi:hypothetical protein
MNDKKSKENTKRSGARWHWKARSWCVGVVDLPLEQ